MKLPLPDYGKPIKVGDLSFVYRGVYHPILWNGEDPYRPRVETLVVNPTGTSIFLRRYEPSPDHKYNYRIPGGSLDNDSDKLTQAKNETNEEALLDISNITYTNIQYFEQYPEGFLLKNGDIPIMYKGTFNDVYIAKYRRKFDKSKIDEHDLDDDMANNGKFYKILDVYKDLRPEHVDALLTSPFVSDLVKRYIRLSETKQVNVFKSNIPSSNKFVGIHEMVDIHSLTPVPKNVKLFHGSPTQNIKELKAFHDDRLYPEFGPVVFVSPYKQFAACYGTRWDDTTMKQYVTNTNDGVNVRISLLDDVQDWNHPCSLYELENDGSLYYLPGHPCEVIGKGPFKVKREERFKTFWDIVKEYNVSVQDQRTGQPVSVMINSEDHMDPKLLSERKVLREGGFYDKDGIWNSIVKIDGELYRGRVETLVFRDGSLYIQLVNKKENDNGTKYRIPGGSLERGVPNQEQAHAECMEEARLLIKNCKFSGVTYNEITGMPKWAKAIDPPVEWVGKHTEVYYAEFDKLYTGYIKKKDREEAMLRDGKFLPIEDVYNILIPEHQKVVDMYIGDKYGSISQESKDFDESYMEVIGENMIVNEKDLEINLDKFKAGKSNVLLITGFSGSGKSTLAKSLASKYRCVHYELDCLVFYLGGRLTREEAIGHEDGLVAFIDGKKISANKNVTTKEEISLYKEYIKFLINWCKKRKDKKFIIEGVQICEVYGDGDSYITSCPMIIKGTSGLVSAIRAAKRNDGSFTKEFGPLIKWVLKDDKALNKLKKDINESYVSESFDSKAYNDYMMNGTSDYLERSYKSMNYTFIPIIGLPAFINVDDLEDTVDEIGRDVLDKYWKHDKGTKVNVYQPFKCYNTLHLKNDDLMNYIYNDANPLERLKIKLYHYNFSRQGRRYSILLITVKNQLKSIYFITNTGELQPIDSAIRESSMYHGESSVQGKIVNENSNATEKKVLNFVYKDNIKFLDKFDRNKDFIIKKGYYANRVSDNNKEITNAHKRVYVTLSKLDHLLYIDSIQDGGLHIRYTEYAPDGYSIRYIINKDLKFPSYHTLIETFIDTVNHYGIEYIASKMDSSSYSKIDFIKEFNSIYYNELNRNSCYCRFIGQIADDTQYSQYFIDALIDKGYSAIIDENDYEFGKGFTKSPIIILDRTSYLRKVSDTVITREILDYASSVTIADMKNAEKTISFGDRIIDCSKEYKALFGDGDKYVLEGVTDFEVSSKDGTGYIVVESGKNSQYHKCTKCGSTNIGVFIQGEPIYKCKECGQYLGTVPFRSEGEDIVSEGFIARILGREDNTSVLIKRHKNPEWFTFLNTCDNIEELIVFRNNANKMIPGIAIIGQRIIACKKKGECKETESYYKSIKKKYIDAGITEKDCIATIQWIEGFIKSMSTKISKLCKERERSLKEGTNLSFVQEDGDIVTEGFINQLVMSAPVKAYNIKNKTPINNMSDLIKYHKNPGLINYVNKCDNIDDLKYIKEDTNTITPSVKIIKERITLCKQMGDCDKTASYYKYIKRKYIDAGITEKDCDATIQWVKDFNKVINIKVGRLGNDTPSKECADLSPNNFIGAIVCENDTDDFDDFLHKSYITESEWKSKYRNKFVSTYKTIINRLRNFDKTLPNDKIIDYPDKDPKDWNSAPLIKFMDDYEGGPNDRASGICTKALIVCEYNEKQAPFFKRDAIESKLTDTIERCIPPDLRDRKNKMYFWIHKSGNKYTLMANSIIMHE